MRPALLLICSLLCTPALAEEGMFPVNDLAGLDLAAAGLEVTATDIFSPSGTALSDAICKVGGCTGSFVSAEGLILTNHHCAFRAIQEAGAGGRDHLTEGFSAADQTAEFPAPGYTVRITEGWRNVSAAVLAAVTPDLTPLERTRAIEQRIKELELEAERQRPDLRADVAETFRGRTYLMFFYTYLKDVRLVYAPPRDVGNFGGEEDNWVWPRHTGDFAFMRAYTGPDGEPAEYSADNVPYQPRVHLEVAANGAEDGDTVFLLGYPGRTFRHRSAAFLRHEAGARMPWIVEWYGWQIDLIEEYMLLAPADANALASRLKGLHNTHKNYRGKLQGIDRLDLIARRAEADAELAAWIGADPARGDQYGDLLTDLDSYYADLDAKLDEEFWLRYLLRSPLYLRLALAVHEAAVERQKPDIERETAYMDRNFDQTLTGLAVRARSVVPEVERAIVAELFWRRGELPPEAVPEAVRPYIGRAGEMAAEELLDDALARTHFGEPDWVRAAAQLSPEEQARLDDPWLDLAAALYPARERQRELGRERRGRLDPLLAALVDSRQQMQGAGFVPDANGTLRLTWGPVRGYVPRDAVYLEPITTVAGLLEKDIGEPPYRLPERLRELAVEGDASVPVCLLYATDTVGGSSGSPVLDARGRVVGLNFDRSWEATINDYAWDEAWSRSIGVDIRYVLWVTGTVDGNGYLVEEMGVGR